MTLLKQAAPHKASLFQGIFKYASNIDTQELLTAGQ